MALIYKTCCQLAATFVLKRGVPAHLFDDNNTIRRSSARSSRKDLLGLSVVFRRLIIPLPNIYYRKLHVAVFVKVSDPPINDCAFSTLSTSSRGHQAAIYRVVDAVWR